ncbi:hypothetical protein JW906_02930 [bacterium]|nr:hypothetical protein [bacterium]
MRKRIGGLLLVLGVAFYARGQEAIISQERFASVNVCFQNWISRALNGSYQFSTPLQVYWPLSRQASLNIYTGHASAGGDELAVLQGLVDTQIFFNYHLPDANLLFGLGVNLPSGKKTLTREEFLTSVQLARPFLNFDVPNLGQGFNISPGVTWVRPFSEILVFGLGASYQYKGGYRFIRDMDKLWYPGHEILLTGGVDVKLAQLTTLAVDIIYTIYGTDRIGDEEVHRPGEKIVVSVQFQKYFGWNRLQVMARYRSRARSQLADAGGLVMEEDKTYPDQIRFFAGYRAPMGSGFSLCLEAEYASFGNPVRLELMGMGLSPEFSLSPNWKAPLRIGFLTGSFENGLAVSGFEYRIGLVRRF